MTICVKEQREKKNVSILKNRNDTKKDARGRRYGDISICIADSLCYKAEANTPL